ncbi:MAG TPA: class I SAM-dependent methyltransferase [Bryobacteraceae bacterium]|nr:class I SAM-dependent methyltransferase [Bryobacteraceae bacterium]
MDEKGEELAAMIAEIRQRVRARNPNGAAPGDIPLPDLTPLLHARDAADAKVASIGTVNPRAPGLVNAVVQRVKRLVARALDWHVREQVEFNRAVMACVQSTLEALNEGNRTMSVLASRLNETSSRFQSETQALRGEAQELKDIRARWSEWHVHWEKTLANTEIQFLRSVAELQGAFHHRVTLMDGQYREQIKAQHADFEGALARSTEDVQKRLWGNLEEIQKRLWEDLAKLRAECDAVVHAELRVLRQKMSISRPIEQAAGSAPAPAAAQSESYESFDSIDWLRFADRFRGSETDIQQRQKIYAARFRGSVGVLDLGCGRGEMLEVLRAAGIPARGVDLNQDSIGVCRSKGLEAEQADLFGYLSALPDASLGGLICCQVVEHLPPQRLPELVRLAHAKLRTGALIAIETPNPECLAIFATHFYIDPTHRHPIPPALASFYLEEAGFGRVEIERLSPACDSMPALAELPEGFRKEFFDGLDYVAFAVKLG